MAFATLLLTAATTPALAIEEPAFRTLVTDQAFSVRQYGPRVVAETEAEGSLGVASNAGFRRVAGYIFGNNQARRAGAPNRIEMTAPITVEARSQKIAMTVPVTTQATAGGWRVQFVMPGHLALEDLPVPGDAAVRLRAVPAFKAAVIRFSGLVGDARLQAQTAKLRAWMQAHGLTAAGEPQLARYDPPWALPFLRRNEVLIPCR